MAALVVLTTVPDAKTGAALARALVSSGAAACVNVIPGLRSIYRWKGKLEDAKEALLVVKTVKKNLTRVRRVIEAEHPYECPELVALPVTAGSPDYLRWLAG